MRATVFVSLALLLSAQASSQQWVPILEWQDAAGMEDAHFGTALAIGDGLVAVGAPGVDSGAVFIHMRNSGGSEQWDVAQVLVPDADMGKDFGSAVCLIDNDLYVGSSKGCWRFALDDLQENFNLVDQIDTLGTNTILDADSLLVLGGAFGWLGSVNGVVRVYARDGSSFQSRAILADPLLSQYGRETCFGYALAADGNRLVVGDPCSPIISLAGPANPRAVVYDRVGDEYEADPGGELVQDLFEGIRSGFGESVALKADTLWVGWSETSGYTWLETPSYTMVDIYTRGFDGTWSRTDSLIPPPEANGDTTAAIGFSLLLDGRDVYVGGDSAWFLFRGATGGTWGPGQMIDVLDSPVRCMARSNGLFAIGVPEAQGSGLVRMYREAVVSIPEHVEDNGAVLYPCPATNEVTIAMHNAKPGEQVELFDALGQRCGAWSWPGGMQMTIDRAARAAGCYTVRIAGARLKLVWR